MLSKLTNLGRVKKIILLITAILILVVCLCWFLLLSSRDRTVITQRYIDFDHQGTNRQYLITSPKEATKDTRIIVGLHGFGDNARRFAYYTGMHNVAGGDDIVIYPQAIKPLESQETGWNAGFCCGSGWKQEADDAGYIISLINKIKKDKNVQEAKVFVTGFSNGAFMSQKLATDYPDSIDGIAVASGSIGTEEKRLSPQKPIPVLLMHGKQDQTVPFEGGFKDTDPEFVWLPFSETEQAWLSVNGDNQPVKRIVYAEDGHVWHDWRILKFWNTKPGASIEAIKFFDSL